MPYIELKDPDLNTAIQFMLKTVSYLGDAAAPRATIERTLQEGIPHDESQYLRSHMVHVEILADTLRRNQKNDLSLGSDETIYKTVERFTHGYFTNQEDVKKAAIILAKVLGLCAYHDVIDELLPERQANHGLPAELRKCAMKAMLQKQTHQLTRGKALRL